VTERTEGNFSNPDDLAKTTPKVDLFFKSTMTTQIVGFLSRSSRSEMQDATKGGPFNRQTRCSNLTANCHKMWHVPPFSDTCPLMSSVADVVCFSGMITSLVTLWPLARIWNYFIVSFDDSRVVLIGFVCRFKLATRPVLHPVVLNLRC
jgi:hypothetical protein